MGIQLKNDQLTPEHKNQALQIIHDNKDLFAKSLADLPGTTLHYHEIDTGNATPQQQRGYRQNPVVQKEMDRQVEDMLTNDIIEESNSMWTALSLLILKKTGDYRFCVDYRKLNSVTKPISFPLPTLSDVIDTIGESKAAIYSLLDFKSGYFQVPLHPNSQDTTTFVCGGQKI